jgi:predicted Rossmann fold flavoprotein
MIRTYKTAVIGAGASGIVAAIQAKRQGDSVVLCERLAHVGKKILASGGGRCNLLNEVISESMYNAEAQPLVKAVLSRVNKEKVISFFKELGLEILSEEGRLFPVTNQASSVVRVLELELQRLRIPTELNFTVKRVSDAGDGFIIHAQDGRTVTCAQLILSGGGKTYPALGSDGSCYVFAQCYGHTVIEPIPVAVPLVSEDKMCHLLQGQRITAEVSLLDGDSLMVRQHGDILFTRYGLSGTAILDISRTVSLALNRLRKKQVVLSVDFLPRIDKKTLSGIFVERFRRGFALNDSMVGLLPNKFGILFKDKTKMNVDDLVSFVKEKEFIIKGTRGWNEAEFTAGGINTNEVEGDTLESRFRKNLYFAGEILNVDGHRGGYNLMWAWASGLVAGLTESI